MHMCKFYSASKFLTTFFSRPLENFVPTSPAKTKDMCFKRIQQRFRICKNLELTCTCAHSIKHQSSNELSPLPFLGLERKKSLAMTVRPFCAAWRAALATSSARWMGQGPTPWTPRSELRHRRVSLRASAPSFTLIPGDSRCWWWCSFSDVAAALLRAHLLQVKAPAPGPRRIDV